MKILEAKVAAIDKTGAERVITSNPGCFMQLAVCSEELGQGLECISYMRNSPPFAGPRRPRIKRIQGGDAYNKEGEV